MNILVPHSWLTEFVKTKARPKDIAQLLSLHSASVEKLEKKNDDWIYEIEITTNRVDMASVNGIAREITAVLNQNSIKAEYIPLQTVNPKKPENNLPITIKNDFKLCRRILAVVIDNIKIGKSQDWVIERLEKSGVRPLNNIVDITNYVMLETGHPTHVFDYDRIKTKKLVIRPSRKGEKITTFEGKNYTLPGDDIVIDDGTGTIVDLPGIAGTSNSVVTDKTKRIIFFIESNDPVRIRNTSMSLGLHTYASQINRNHPDSDLSKTAMLRGIKLYQKIAKAKLSSIIIDQYKRPDITQPVLVTNEKIKTFIGRDFSEKEIIHILRPLGFLVKKVNNGYLATPPTWRRDDVSIAEDIIEEIARIYGYHNIKSRVQIGTPVSKPNNNLYWINRIKHTLRNWGFTEIFSSSLVSEQLLTTYGFNSKKSIRLRNPLSEDGEIMRPSLIPSVLDAMSVNKNRKNELKLFELSRVYQRDNKEEDKPVAEPTMLTFALTAEKDPFLKAKGYVESLLNELGIKNFRFIPEMSSDNKIENQIHPKKRASITIQQSNNGTIKIVGFIGQIENYILVDIDFEVLMTQATSKHTYVPIPEYPPVIEDMTIPIKHNTYIGPVIDTIYNSNRLVKKVELVDHFKNNVTFRITFQDPKKNLTDKEVSKIKEKIVKKMHQK